jgi:membrane peptidoglycan carboxypeptidase
VVSEDTADKMNMMLRGVVAVGTGKRAAIPGFVVAGKTGTAAKPQPNGTYIGDDGVMRYRATFVGFVPAGAPSLSILVTVDEPVGDIYGGSVAAPVFADIADSAIRILGITPPTTDRAARFIDALPPEAVGLPGLDGSAVPRVTDAEGAPVDGAKVRAQPVAAVVPTRASGGGA